MIDAQTCVPSEGIPEIIPECVNLLIRIQATDRICPVVPDQFMKSFPGFWSEQRILKPALRFVYIYIGGHHVEIAGDQYRALEILKLFCTFVQAVKPFEFIVEL